MHLDAAKKLYHRAINNKDAIKQKWEYIKDIINSAKPNSHIALVFPADMEVTYILMRKAFTPSLKRKAAAKNFTLELSLRNSTNHE